LLSLYRSEIEHHNIRKVLKWFERLILLDRPNKISTLHIHPCSSIIKLSSQVCETVLKKRMICPNCQTPNPEEARFCLNCGHGLRRYCSNCQAELRFDARFCMHCGQPILRNTAQDEAYFDRLAAATPAPLAEKVLAASALSGERRIVTVLHLDVVGSTAIAEKIGEESWARIMTDAYDRFAQVIYFYEGTIARLLGDALVAFFGAPVIHEDDPIRAANAALELIHIAQDYKKMIEQEHEIDFSVRACLNTGPVVIGPIGGNLRYDFTPVGGVVNLAARIKFAANPMAVLISENTYSHISPVFDCVDLGLIEVADRPEPVRVYQVLRSKIVPGSLRGLAGFESPMVGREVELASLQKLCDAVQAGLGRVVLVSGDPGIGKSRLIHEWKTAVMADPMLSASFWVEGRCLSYGGGLPYHLIIDLLYSLLGVHHSAGEAQVQQALQTLLTDYFGPEDISQEEQEIYPFLGHLLSLRLEGEDLAKVKELDPQSLQSRYISAFRDLLLKLCSRQPVIIVLEDLHWADPSSINLLIKNLTMVSAASVLFCLITRVELDTPGWKLVSAAREIMGGGMTEISLDGLSDSESRQMVTNLLEVEALHDKTRDLILTKSEGNPFFVEELIRMLIDRGAIIQKNGDWIAGEELEKIEIPDNLQGLLLTRIDRLPDDVKQTLKVASVIGRQFSVKVLEQVLGVNVK
jgi:class 3 adenylate cyclase